MNNKALALRLLAPFAHLTSTILEPLRRAWAHARLAEKIHSSLDLSVVILDVPEVHGTGRITFGAHLYLYRELYFETQGDGEIFIGDNVVISRGVHIVSFAQVRVGAGSMIGEYTSLRDANHRFSHAHVLRTAGYDAAPITVGCHVWIGRGVTVLPGVTIGDRAVVGANAVVTRDVPAGAVVVGAPAKPVPVREAA